MARKDSISQHYIMYLIVLIPFLMGINIDLFVPSLPAIAVYYHTPISLTQLTISSYLLAYGIGQSFLGVYSDYSGRRSILRFCALVYVGVSFIGILSPNITLLIGIRFIQGICLGGLSVVIRAVVADIFAGINLTKAMNNISISWSLGPIIGPVIGSYLQHYWNWQADFCFFGLYGLFLLIIIQFFLPETMQKKYNLPANMIFYHLKQIISNRTFISAAIIGALIYSILILFNLIGPFLIEDVLQYSALAYGRVALFMGLSYCIGNLLNRLLINYFQPMKISQIVLAIALFLCVVMVILNYLIPLTLSIVTLPTLILFIFCGLILPNMLAKFSSLFTNTAGTANAVAGLLVSFITGTIGLVGAQFKTDSNIPLVSLYTILILTSLTLFYGIKRAQH